MTWEQELNDIYDQDRFYREVFVEHEYKRAKRGSLKTVIDAGACGGEFSYWMYHTAEKIYAIEPEPTSFKEINDFVTKHNLYKIIPCNLALSDKNGFDDLVVGSRGSHTLGYHPTANIKVKTQTLATFMKEHNIEQVDVLKIDIEDGELRVFGSVDFPEVADKIKFIIGEHHVGDEFLKENGFKITNHEGEANWTAERI